MKGLQPQKPTSKAQKQGRKRAGVTQMSRPAQNFVSPFNSTAFPSEVRVRLRYTELAAMTTGALAPNGADGNFGTEWSYRTNSLFDPDYAFGGHQPYMFDTYAALYGNYRVEGVKYNVTFSCPGSGASDVLCAVSYGVSTTASLTSKTPARPVEWPNCQSGILSVAGQRTRQLSGYIDNASLIGVSRTRYVGGDDYQAAVTASPVVFGLINVAVASPAAFANQGVSALIVLEYDAVFYNRYQQPQS